VKLRKIGYTSTAPLNTCISLLRVLLFITMKVKNEFDKSNVKFDLNPRWYDYFFLLRPILWIPVWTFLFLGYFWGSALETFSFTLFLPWKFWAVFFLYSLMMSSVYIINQIVDWESDLINNKLFLIPYNIISIRTATIYAIILALISLIFAYFLGIKLVILFIFSYLLGLAYSIKPVELKARPIADMLANAIGYGVLAFLTGWATAAEVQGRAFIQSFGYVLFVSAVFINTTIPDIHGDQAAGKHTIGVFLGARNATILSSILLFLSFIYSFLEFDVFLMIPSLIGLPIFIMSIWDKSMQMAKISYRAVSFLFVLMVALRFPLFLVLGVLILILLRIYYTKRFLINYPSLTGR